MSDIVMTEGNWRAEVYKDEVGKTKSIGLLEKWIGQLWRTKLVAKIIGNLKYRKWSMFKHFWKDVWKGSMKTVKLTYKAGIAIENGVKRWEDSPTRKRWAENLEAFNNRWLFEE